MTKTKAFDVVLADFSDRNEFYRQVGRLPLTPGTSHLCRSACPNLVDHYRSLLLQDRASKIDLHESLRNPETIELGSMLQLVLNCQQRQQLEMDARRQPTLPLDEPVEVPNPGVPFNYLGIPVPNKDAPLHQEAMDTIVGEYDWLEKLVLERSS